MALCAVPLRSYAQVNGELWPDTKGKHINAHGGNIIKYKGTFYWYGENRPYRGFTTEAGVGVYSGKDLKICKDEGIALAVSEQKGHDIERGCIMERPKVIYNRKNNKFIMLFHLELKGKGYEAARVAFAESDSPTGPFRYLRSTRIHAGRWPFNMTEQEIAYAKTTKANDWKDWWTPEWRQETERGMYLWRDFESGQMSRDSFPPGHDEVIRHTGEGPVADESAERLGLIGHQLDVKSGLFVDLINPVPYNRKDFLRDGLVRILPDGVARFDCFEQCHRAVRFIPGQYCRCRQGRGGG